MRALQQVSLDGPRDLRLITDAPVPVPGPDEILIRVGAAGVNFADVMQTRGTYVDGPQAPYLAGFEAAGEVVALGEGVGEPTIGTHVVGTGYGAFAEYAVLPAAGTLPVPPGWSDEQALGLVLNWATALAALRPLGRLTAGETVLIHAAAGGVGQAATTLARHYGATVIGVASPGKHHAVRADHVLDHRSTDLVAEVARLTGGAGVDLVLESVGGDLFRAALASAKRITGRVVVYGMAAGGASVSNRELNFVHPVQVMGLHIGVLSRTALFAELLSELDALREAGVLRPGRPTVYDLADGPKVLAEMEASSTIGKLALRPC
ncbi:zinc-binding dehydrogenase [Cryptosporangium aurantiacum]|uniref:NADPH2:quinone reductase n=1 Tax=Cryptosporangium aurantiacum TaxID=134849 RepID=A0A1M7RM59_9ACTN|nr:zinc-binding dehydrogenase [Cryptosporangium aurantiacum]SHN47260.1 NADPH2:quinone reductase [Cryptosporangium aurantiacum]